MLLEDANVVGGLGEHRALGALRHHHAAGAQQLAELVDLLGYAEGSLLLAHVALFPFGVVQYLLTAVVVVAAVLFVGVFAARGAAGEGCVACSGCAHRAAVVVVVVEAHHAQAAAAHGIRWSFSSHDPDPRNVGSSVVRGDGGRNGLFGTIICGADVRGAAFGARVAARAARCRCG